MTEYLLLIRGNAKSRASVADWDGFIALAKESGLFRGGSALGDSTIVGVPSSEDAAQIVGFMRFDSEDKDALLRLLRQHPIVVHGGSVELREMTES